MKRPIQYIVRQTGEVKEEKVYFESAISFLYNSFLGRAISRLIASAPLLSKLYGWWQTLPLTRKKIIPFVNKYEIDTSEFAEPISAYRSFNDFFIRKLKPGVRPIEKGVVLPADGRYLFYQNIEECKGFLVKGKKFSLPQLLQDIELAKVYRDGSLVLARLCPTDYHRFHFPCDCIPGEARLINGPLYSVNPVATKRRIEIFAENKRVLTRLKTEIYGDVLFIEVGATMVGSVHQTYTPNEKYNKGDEKGYFSFGGSSIIMLFQSGKIQIDKRLLNNSTQFIETLCLYGQSVES